MERYVRWSEVERYVRWSERYAYPRLCTSLLSSFYEVENRLQEKIVEIFLVKEIVNFLF